MNFFDLHCDTACRLYKENLTLDNDLLAVTPEKASAFEKWYQCFAIFVKDGTQNPFEFYKAVLSRFKEQSVCNAQNLEPIITVEGGLLVEKDLNRVEALYNDGVCALTLTWNGENQIAGGADTDAGLKDFGCEVIRKLNKFGIAVDLSHLNKKSFYDALELAERPIVTHSCLEFVHKHKRNIDDGQLKLLVQKNGVFGLCFYPEFLGDGDVFENVYKNIFHILDMGYEDYLSIGSDFDGVDMSDKLYDISYIPALYEFLKYKNISENILNKIFFENAYNFFKKGEL